MSIRVQYSPEVVVEDLDDDICLYRPDIDEVVVLNTTAADVWRLADGELTLDQLVHRLASAYQLPTDRLESDVRSVFTDLLDRGYLIAVGAERTPTGPAEPAPRAE